MKKFFAMMTMILAAASMSGCNEALVEVTEGVEEDYSTVSNQESEDVITIEEKSLETDVSDTEVIAVDEQIDIIWDNAAMWLADSEAAMYAVTDLDGNGRLEILSSVPGNDVDAENSIYEVNEAGSGLMKHTLESNLHPIPAISCVNEMDRFKSEDSILYYFVAPSESEGNTYKLHVSFSIGDGSSELTFVGEEIMSEGENGKSTETYINRVYDEVDKDGMLAGISEWFEGMTVSKVSIGWDALAGDSLREKLLNSYNVFMGN